mmetsp:Transcript_24903/g.59138  ORF Transcript_24903/g.59138 Transcript_24903/m.59138 type:complete len:212 (+) Transcript_24903:159-794(+)
MPTWTWSFHSPRFRLHFRRKSPESRKRIASCRSWCHSPTQAFIAAQRRRPPARDCALSTAASQSQALRHAKKALLQLRCQQSAAKSWARCRCSIRRRHLRLQVLKALARLRPALSEATSCWHARVRRSSSAWTFQAGRQVANVLRRTFWRKLLVTWACICQHENIFFNSALTNPRSTVSCTACMWCGWISKGAGPKRRSTAGAHHHVRCCE